MRLDRSLTLGIWYPLSRATGADRKRTLPILMYHSISSGAEDGVHPYYKTKTQPEQFQQHLATMKAWGYKGFSLEEASERWNHTPFWEENHVVFTFDDGFADFYHQALQPLQCHGFSATVFLITDSVGHSRRQFKGLDCLSWAEVKECRAKGIRFGSHTVHHPNLERLSAKEIRQELRISKDHIEQQLQESISTFAFPYAFPETNADFLQFVKETLAEVGYRCAVTTKVGCAKPEHSLFELPRLPINTADDGALLQAKLNGGYDWFGKAQYVYKRCKQWANYDRKPVYDATSA